MLKTVLEDDVTKCTTVSTTIQNICIMSLQDVDITSLAGVLVTMYNQWQHWQLWRSQMI